ncbi:MAG TPA: thioredoxin domain-containing protein [Candidatus Limnocylindrales bacterium]|nr:thioredoxin domain-containing protein [Candidatus Limnocylindrales bacterium]
MSDPRPANRLAGETSPYLLQHAHNPVDWWPWGPDALARAKLLDRPIFLSIGYAACHWCHVMERESFEDEATATFLNEHFIPIKVDREERPDLDQIYMTAVQAMTGSGGWPMSVFLTPAGRPFFGGTYFPDTPRHGMPSFRQVLEGVAAAWQRDRVGVEGAGSRLVEAIAASSRTGAGGTGLPAAATLDVATAAIEQSFDGTNGGWGGAPKFPQPMTIELLLRRHAATGDARPLAIARRSLDAMADGGIRDQLGGGFHRYSTTADWLVPHFEQMLYDNAQLARVYGHAYAATRDPRYLDVATATLDYLLRELRTEDGGFAASQDADTEGEEGGTFVWTLEEIRDVLGADADMFAAAYGVGPAGNWEGRTILSRVRDDAAVASTAGIAPEEVAARLAAARARLLEHRHRRPQPARDDKVLAGWNGLAIGALADAARIVRAALPGDLRADRYVAAAREAAGLVLERLVADGRLRRSWKDGRATADGVLEDHANLADGLLALYEATFEERWFTAARELADTILGRFADPAGGFFDTAADAEALVVRPKDIQDNATPSGNAMATTVLLRLAALTGDGRYRDAAESALATVGDLLARYPTGFAQWLAALDFAHAPVAEVAIVGTLDEPGTTELAAATVLPYRPSLVLAGSGAPEASAVPLLRDRTRRDGRPTAYVCRGFACRLPVTDAAALEAELAAVAGA